MNELDKTKNENAISFPIAKDDGEYSMYLDKVKFDQGFRTANLLSTTMAVPAHYRGKPAECFIALASATRLGVDPILYMQHTFVIQGKQGMDSQLVIGLVNARGPFKGPIHFAFTGEGETRACTAWAIHKADGIKCEATVTWSMVELEGWSKKPGSKWLTITDQMFQYRSATFLARLYCPEVILGFQTTDELQDIEQPVEQSGQPAPVSALEDRLAAKQVVNEADAVQPYPQEAKEAVTPTVKRGRKPKAEPMIEEPPLGEAELPPTPEDDIPFGEPVQEPDPTAKIRPEERYLCTTCDEVFAESIGANKTKCPRCFNTTVVDRMKLGA